jgi:hypothetical protein
MRIEQFLWTLWTSRRGVIGLIARAFSLYPRCGIRRGLNGAVCGDQERYQDNAEKGGATLTQVARGRAGGGTVRLVFVRQHDRDNGFTVITRACDKFQLQGLAPGCMPIARHALQAEPQLPIDRSCGANGICGHEQNIPQSS